MSINYYIHTFGCQQNAADSERIAAYCESAGMRRVETAELANYVVINTCMIRESAENRVYGLVNNLKTIKEKKIKNGEQYTIVITGCMVGMAVRDKTGKLTELFKKRMPAADIFLPIDETGFELKPLRSTDKTALIPITHGCNNFCSFCVVPYTRGREVSRPYQQIVNEAMKAHKEGFTEVLLLGQNVNSYGSDLVLSKNQPREFTEWLERKKIKPVYVKHLGKSRIPTLFPQLLEDIAKIGFKKVDFISSNPWDFSDELIHTIRNNPNITRTLHLAVQSGDDAVLKRMNRWYTSQEYISLHKRIKDSIPDVKITTDIIVGFCGETDKEFENTVRLCETVTFDRAFISIYSNRRGTHAFKYFQDDIPHEVKERRWRMLDRLVNSRYYNSV